MLSPQQLATKTWDLYQTHGVPIEVSLDILEQQGLKIDQQVLNDLISEHQKLSQTVAAGQFKAGLGSDTPKTRALHTTTHILHSVLREIFGEEVKQKGSSIEESKARFDISLEQSLTPELIARVEAQVQSIINQKLDMINSQLPELEARSLGAIGLFGEKYGDIVSVYSLTDSQGQVHSREFCGGPHIINTKEIGTFKILKQKSIGQGLKRIEFDLE